ncbi:MAG TPA: hypothetical protein VF815_02560 [Myxococcaceae bacterium]
MGVGALGLVNCSSDDDSPEETPVTPFELEESSLSELQEGMGSLTDQAYLDARAKVLRATRDEGLDKIMADNDLDAIVAASGGPAWPTNLVVGDHFQIGSSSAAAGAGDPIISVPAGDIRGLPVGINFIGTAWSEPTLLKLAYAFEQATKHRKAPRYLPTLELP